MTTPEQAPKDVLGDVWNALNRGDLENTPVLVDPELLRAVQALHRLDHTRAPDPSFVTRLERQLMIPQTSALKMNDLPVNQSPLLVGEVSAHTSPRLPISAETGRASQHFALAALIVLALAGTLLTSAGAFRPSGPRSAAVVLPAIELAEEPALTFVREIFDAKDPLVWPSGFAVGKDGTLYVVDVASNTVRVFDRNGNSIATWGGPGEGPGEFLFNIEEYGDVAVAPNGNVLVLDPSNPRVQEFSADGTLVRSWGSRGEGPGQFLFPNSVDVDPQGHVYVTDYLNHRVQVFDSGGTFLAEWDGTKGGGTPLAGPTDVAVDASGIAWVSDDILHRVFAFDRDGAAVKSLGGIGDKAGQLRTPTSLAFDADGNLFVAESDGKRIQVFNPEGKSLAILNVPGENVGQFGTPIVLAFDPDGDLYVTDRESRSLRLFSVTLPGAPTS